ncbi:MAG: glycosyltransferase family 4 protein [Proteobacteria bacterium]|nr:glycosyltransferase family 4 protein [Pseudomonadota bacterium]
MRVGLDARCLNTVHPRGMGKYVYEVIAHAEGVAPIEWTLFGERPELPMVSPPGVRAQTEVFPFRGYRYHLWEQAGLPARARRGALDVLHCAATTLPWWQPIPTVATVHDAILWHSPSPGGFQGWYLHSLIPRALRRCAAVITISEASRRDLVELWPWIEPKLVVIPHGVSDVYFEPPAATRPEALAMLLGAQRYLVYVGGAIARKRLDWALALLAALGDRSLRLVTLGFRPDEIPAAQATIPEAVREQVVFAPFVSESDMPALYRGALAVLYPTLYEGFGLPALEAQAVGTPVFFSPLGSLAELVGPGARVLDAHDMPAWLDALRAIVRDGEAPDRAEASRAWARGFSWQVSARRHVEVYAAAAAKR